jgi:uncharacterized membrane protein YphA (DoxX/SURF4 family)
MTRDTIYKVQVVVGLIVVAAGLAKLAGADMMVRQFEVIGLGQWLRPVAGLLEIIGGLALFVPRAAAYGAALLALTILGSTGALIGHIATASGVRQQMNRPQVTTATYYQIRTEDLDATDDACVPPQVPPRGQLDI